MNFMYFWFVTNIRTYLEPQPENFVICNQLMINLLNSENIATIRSQALFLFIFYFNITIIIMLMNVPVP